MGAPSDQFLRLLWRPPYVCFLYSYRGPSDQFLCILYWGPHTFFACYMGAPSRGVPRIWEGGGGARIFFSDLGICMSRSDMLRMAKPCALLGGMLPREIFLKRCNLVRFRVYFDQILYLFFFKHYHFLYKK